MRIGVDLTCWANGRGYGRFTRELLRTMFAAAPEDRFICYADEASATKFDGDWSNVELLTVPQRVAPSKAAAADGYRSPADMLRFTRAVWRRRPDVFFSPSVYSYFPLPPGVRAVVTVHDTIAERFPDLTLPSFRARLFWRLKVALALRQANLVLTVSEFSAGEIASVLRVDPSRIRVAGEAPSPVYQPGTPDEVSAAARRLGLATHEDWFVYVGGFNPHKQVELLVQAHAVLVARTPPGASPPRLLLVGGADRDVFHQSVASIEETIAACGTTEQVTWTGYLPDEELRMLHSGAVALVLPSACEGFGLPAVEAAACGTPVVATTASPLPRLLQGGGLFVEPGDVGQLTEAMGQLLLDHELRRRMGRVARERAEALDWETGARAALAAIREAAR